MNEATNMSLLTSTDHKLVTLGPAKKQNSQETSIGLDHSNVQVRFHLESQYFS